MIELDENDTVVWRVDVPTPYRGDAGAGDPADRADRPGRTDRTERTTGLAWLVFELYWSRGAVLSLVRG